MKFSDLVRGRKPGYFETLVKGGPYYGPRGGKYADPKHTITWDESKHGKGAKKKKTEEKPKKKRGFKALVGSLKKIFGKTPTPTSREKLEALATDKGAVAAIAKSDDVGFLSSLRDTLLSHGAKLPKAKEPKAKEDNFETMPEAEETAPKEDNFETMPEAEETAPEAPKEPKAPKKQNPLNKLLRVVSKRLGELEGGDEKEETKSEDNFETMPEGNAEAGTSAVALAEALRSDLAKKYKDDFDAEEFLRVEILRAIDAGVTATPEGLEVYKRSKATSQWDAFSHRRKTDKPKYKLTAQMKEKVHNILSSLGILKPTADAYPDQTKDGSGAIMNIGREQLNRPEVKAVVSALAGTPKRSLDDAWADVDKMHDIYRRKAAVGLGIGSDGEDELIRREEAISQGKASMVDGEYVEAMPEGDAEATKEDKAEHPEDRHEKVDEAKTRGLGDHSDKLSNILLDGKPIADDTAFVDHLEVEDYPYGRLRTTAKFTIETDKRGRQRAVMQTINPKTGRENKPKKATYSGSVKFFMHEGKTYVLEHSSDYGSIHIRTVAGGFRDARMQTTESPRMFSSISPNMGRGESDDHPAGYMAMYEAVTGKPAPKVQDFKDARKRMEDRREAQRKKTEQVIQELQETRDRKAAVGLGISASSSELEAREKDIKEGKGGYQNLAHYKASGHAKLVDEGLVQFGEKSTLGGKPYTRHHNPKFVDGVARGKFRISRSGGETEMVSGIIAGQYGLDSKGGITHIPSGMRVGSFDNRDPAKRVALLLSLDKKSNRFGHDLRPGDSLDKYRDGLNRMQENIKATIHDEKTPKDAHRAIRDLMPGSLTSPAEKAEKAASLKSAATAKTQAKLDSLGHFKADKGLDFSVREGAELKASADMAGETVMRSDAHKLAAEFAYKSDDRGDIVNVLHREGQAVATDGHRMIVVPTDNKQAAGFVLPGKKADADHKKRIKNNRSIYSAEDIAELERRHARKDDAGGFPNVDALLGRVEGHATNRAVASVPHLQAAADHALAAAKRDGIKPADAVVVLHLEDGHLLATSQAEGHPVLRVGKTEGSIRAGSESTVRMPLSAKYLKDALRHSGKSAGKKSVSIRVEDHLSAMMLEHDNGVKHVIMPLRLDEMQSEAAKKLDEFNSFAELGPRQGPALKLTAQE